MVERYIDKEFQINKDFLDTIDFIPFLKQYRHKNSNIDAVEHYIQL